MPCAAGNTSSPTTTRKQSSTPCASRSCCVAFSASPNRRCPRHFSKGAPLRLSEKPMRATASATFSTCASLARASSARSWRLGLPSYTHYSDRLVESVHVAKTRCTHRGRCGLAHGQERTRADDAVGFDSRRLHSNFASEERDLSTDSENCSSGGTEATELL